MGHEVRFLHIMLKFATIMLMLDAQKISPYIMLKRRLPGFVVIIRA